MNLLKYFIIKKSKETSLFFSFLNSYLPTPGLGIGLDRLFAIILNQRSIQDIIYFPFVKRK